MKTGIVLILIKILLFSHLAYTTPCSRGTEVICSNPIYPDVVCSPLSHDENHLRCSLTVIYNISIIKTQVTLTKTILDYKIQTNLPTAIHEAFEEACLLNEHCNRQYNCYRTVNPACQ